VVAVVDLVFDYVIDTAQRIFINTARHYANRLFSTQQRIY